MSDVRTPPGQEGRADYLNNLNKAPLREEADLLDAQIAELQVRSAELALQVEELQAALRVQEEQAAGALSSVSDELRAARIAGDALAEERDALAEELEKRQAHDPGDCVSMVRHFSGSDLAGNQRQLIRCAPKGEYSDSWMVRVGGQIFTDKGHPMPYRPYRQIRASLQPKVRMPYDEARALLESLPEPRRR